MINKNNLWVEKYRPSNLDEISAQATVVKSLKASSSFRADSIIFGKVFKEFSNISSG
jgi:hypothetical protein